MVILRPLEWLRWHVRHGRRSLARAVRSPGRERDLLVQSAESAIAAGVAWIIADAWLNTPHAFLAPLVALMVNAAAPVALRRLLAVVCGVLVATGGYLLIGDRTVTLVLVLLVLMPFVYGRALGDGGMLAPVTAVLLLTTGNSTAVSLLLAAVLGAVLGLLAAVVPPMRPRDARESIAGVADGTVDLLCQVAGGLRAGWTAGEARGWLRGADRLAGRVDEAWAAVRWSRDGLIPRSRRGEDLTPVLLPLEVMARQAQGICRTLVDATEEGVPSPDSEFCADVLEHAASVVRAHRYRHLAVDISNLPHLLRAAHERNEQLRAEELRLDGRLDHAPLLIEVDHLLAALDRSP
jgi:hypothetical protein